MLVRDCALALRTSVKDRFARLNLSILQQFLLGAAVTIVISMAALAYTISERIKSLITNNVAQETAVLMAAIIGPAAQELANTNQLSREATSQLDATHKSLLSEGVLFVKIWLPDATLAYSTNKQQIGQNFPSADLNAALAGKIIGSFDTSDEPENAGERNTKIPLIEVYAPLYRTGTRDVIAVGEFYKDARHLAAELRPIQVTVASLVAAITAPMMLVLYVIASRASRSAEQHRESLRRKVEETQLLANQNDRLRQSAEHARLEAVRSNENLLQHIGQDLHDGPIQILSLLILRLSDPSEKQTTIPKGVKPRSELQTPQDLAVRTLKELRDISNGLVLPELENLTATEALWLAVRSHEFSSGTTVDCKITGLPDDLSRSQKICLYRIVQEGLNNALRHAGGHGQQVEAFADADWISLVVRDRGREDGPNENDSKRNHTPLGISGLRKRVEILRGSFEFFSTDSGAEIWVKLPIYRQ